MQVVWFEEYRIEIMARKSLSPLGDTELEVLQHVWDLGKATVAQVQERILNERKVAYTTVMTVMKNLTNKGYLAYDHEGVTYVYYPLRRPEEVRGSLLRTLIDKVFNGSPAALVQSLVEEEELSEDERKELMRLIERLEKRP